MGEVQRRDRAQGALVRGAAMLLVLLIAPGAQAQDSSDAQRKLEQAQRELKAVAAERRKIEGQRGSASKELRTLDERLGRASRALHDTDIELGQQQQALADLEKQRDTTSDDRRVGKKCVSAYRAQGGPRHKTK